MPSESQGVWSCGKCGGRGGGRGGGGCAPDDELPLRICLK